MENGLYDEYFVLDEWFGGVKYLKCSNGWSSFSYSVYGNLFCYSFMKYLDDKCVMKVCFYRNGDWFFKGIVYVVFVECFWIFELLMVELILSLVCDKNILLNGVWYIFMVENGYKIWILDELEEGESYVCVFMDVFKYLDYICMQSLYWNVNNKVWGSGLLLGYFQGLESDFKDYVKFKLVMVIWNGFKFWKVVRVLLNKKMVQFFDQVFVDIIEVIKLDFGVVCKIFILDGRQVNDVIRVLYLF